MQTSARTPRLLMAAAVVVSLLAGCGEPLTAYYAAGHDPSRVGTVMVLPFMDARTFRSENDPANDTIGTDMRGVFAEALRRQDRFAGVQILEPDLVRPSDSLTVEDALSYGRGHGADLVVVGQVFSYTDTRAASIPPRAGMFVRFVSVPEERLVFVGDHYLNAGAPGAEGGREKQARLVCDAILNSYAKAAESREAGGVVDLRREDVTTRGVANLVPTATENVATVLFLPYHELPNPANLVEKTGGGAVVTSLYQMELARLGSFRLANAQSGQVSSSALLPVEEALSLARQAGADYVVRGQVVEFRRAASVPSLYSVVISTALLAAQVLFAEMSGVDVATEVWRVEDGVCVYAKRDRSRQKYVVQAEKTVRRLAQSTIPELASAINNAPEAGVEPLIDSIVLPPLEVEHSGGDGEDGVTDVEEVAPEEVEGGDVSTDDRGDNDGGDNADGDAETDAVTPEDAAPASGPATEGDNDANAKTNDDTEVEGDPVAESATTEDAVPAEGDSPGRGAEAGDEADAEDAAVKNPFQESMDGLDY